MKTLEVMVRGKFGRPTIYTPQMLDESLEYLNLFSLKQGERECLVDQEVIPTIVGLCRYIKRSKSTVYSWLKDEDKGDFLDIVSAIEESQHISLVSGGLSGSYNPMITKLILSKHGYSEKTEVDNTSSDGSMTPKAYSPEQYKNAQNNINDVLDDLD